MDKLLHFFLDTGLCRYFMPLAADPTTANLMHNPNASVPESLNAQYDELATMLAQGIVPGATMNTVQQYCMIAAALPNGMKSCGWLSTYARWYLGEKRWTLENGLVCKLYGVWFEIDTNTAAGDRNAMLPADPPCDRGVMLTEPVPLSTDERAQVLAVHAAGKPYGNMFNRSPYIDLKEGVVGNPFAFNELGLNGLNVVPVSKQIHGNQEEVSLILDIGNTRSVGILFRHLSGAKIDPDDLAKKFTILELNADPSAGATNSRTNADKGITPSWILLHAKRGQFAIPKGGSTVPPLERCCADVTDLVVESTRKGLFRKVVTQVRADPPPMKRMFMPQMFNTLAPVSIGEEAASAFRDPYAKALCENGGHIQQSSPKRYYWDDGLTNFDWVMMLNKEDPAQAHFKQGVGMPTIQGEMLRHLDDKGEYVDIENATARPQVNPLRPRYPRGSTLTWLMLHILERASEQIHDAYSQSATNAFVPCQIGKILVTYPAGWTEEEITGYRKRCDAAISIFNDRNIYRNGVASVMRNLELASVELSPDEAVAGQLPFIFSEINRFAGIPAESWISISGKWRDGVSLPTFGNFGQVNGETTGNATSLRVMNFDIGGGTTDISIVEYADCRPHNAAVSDKYMSTRLLFKDGRAIAGDDILKRVIEKCVLGELLPKLSPGHQAQMKLLLSGALAQHQVMMGRITRNCLIPLGNYCLSNSTKTKTFSAADAGIADADWGDFVDVVDTMAKAAKDPLFAKANLGRIQQHFRVDAAAISKIVSEEFSTLMKFCSMYIAEYDVDLVIFSGKTSELNAVRTLAEEMMPIDNTRMIFARQFKPGAWYPFRDEEGCIADAKTVTAVGAALYYALRSNLVDHWHVIPMKPNQDDNINEWGDWDTMDGPTKKAFMDCTCDSATVMLAPGAIIARRRNICAEPECVYKFEYNGSAKHSSYTVNFRRKGERLEIASVVDMDARDFSLKLWPCPNQGGRNFWQETGIYN